MKWVTVSSPTQRTPVRSVYYKFHKPKDVICTLDDPRGRDDLAQFLKHLPEGLFPVGRLDRHTTGLLLFTNDGEMANRILHPSYELEKVYRVTIDRSFKDSDCRRLLGGFFLEDGPVKFSSVERVSDVTVMVAIHEGRNRIVRRSFATLGYEVKGLKRLAIGPILLGNLDVGKFAKFSIGEMHQLKRALSL